MNEEVRRLRREVDDLRDMLVAHQGVDTYRASYHAPHPSMVLDDGRFIFSGAISSSGTLTLPFEVYSPIHTLTPALVTVDTFEAAASDDLDSIDGVSLRTGAIAILRAANSARTVVVRDGVGNLKLSGNFSLDHAEDTIMLVFTGTDWLELSRSNNNT